MCKEKKIKWYDRFAKRILKFLMYRSVQEKLSRPFFFFVDLILYTAYLLLSLISLNKLPSSDSISYSLFFIPYVQVIFHSFVEEISVLNPFNKGLLGEVGKEQYDNRVKIFIPGLQKFKIYILIFLLEIINILIIFLNGWGGNFKVFSFICSFVCIAVYFDQIFSAIINNFSANPQKYIEVPEDTVVG